VLINSSPRTPADSEQFQDVLWSSPKKQSRELKSPGKEFEEDEHNWYDPEWQIKTEVTKNMGSQNCLIARKSNVKKM
jgi:hypothetical protein